MPNASSTRLPRALAALEGEGRGDDAHSQDTHGLGDRRHDRRRAAAGAAAHARLDAACLRSASKCHNVPNDGLHVVSAVRQGKAP